MLCAKVGNAETALVAVLHASLVLCVSARTWTAGDRPRTEELSRLGLLSNDTSRSGSVSGGEVALAYNATDSYASGDLRQENASIEIAFYESDAQKSMFNDEAGKAENYTEDSVLKNATQGISVEEFVYQGDRLNYNVKELNNSRRIGQQEIPDDKSTSEVLRAREDVLDSDGEEIKTEAIDSNTSFVLDSDPKLSEGNESESTPFMAETVREESIIVVPQRRKLPRRFPTTSLPLGNTTPNVIEYAIKTDEDEHTTPPGTKKYETITTAVSAGKRPMVAKMQQLNKPSLSLCCPLGHFLVNKECILNSNLTVPELPAVYNTNLEPENISTSDENFDFLIWDPCKGSERWPLMPFGDETPYLLRNGSIYKPYDEESHILLYNQFCLAVSPKHVKEYLVIVCDDFVEEVAQSAGGMTFSVSMIASVPFLIATFVVYSLIPDLKNIHGYTLRAYVGSLATAYTLLVVIQLTPQKQITREICISFAFIIHFSFLSSFFWLNVMCFDIWWTFGGFRSLQGSAKQRERKKFTLYSIYAWGSASLITGICILMDYLPNIPENFIKPEFGVESCWFKADAARAIYFYGPMGVTVFCNICLFVSTAIKIGQHKKDTAHHLKSSESRRHDDNKQWFNLYLKLFIVMGINWSMEIISWLCKGPQYVWYITDLPNSLQGLIIFIIFVWKDKIKRLLLKRFGCHERNFHSRNSTRSVCNSSASRTCTTSAPLQEKTNPFVNENTRNKIISEESDCA